MIYLKQLFLPLILANVFHMIVVKFNLFSFLNIAIAKSVFGQNKTYRGFVFVTAASAFFVWLLNTKQLTPLISNFMLGASLGFVYVFMELPNSFIKRRLGIRPGESSERYKYISILIDKSDSTFGTVLCFGILTNLPLSEMAIIFLLAFSVHLSVSYLLVITKIKKSL